MRLLIIFLLCLLTLIGPARANEKSEAFLVTIYDRFVKVVSPDKAYTQTSIIIENKTLSTIVGKIQRGKTDLHFLTLEPQNSKSLQVKIVGNEPLLFVPLSPSSQEVQLLIGKKSYEIPPQK